MPDRFLSALTLSVLAVFLACLVFPPSASSLQPDAPEALLKASVEPSSVAVGGVVKLTLSYTIPSGAKIGSPPEIRGLEDLSVTAREVNKGRIVVSILADTVEDLKIGPLKLGYRDKDGQKWYIRAEAIPVKVVSNLKQGEGELRPIQGIIPTGNRWLKWALVAGLGLLIIAAAAGIVLALKRWSSGRAFRLPQDPPHVRAEKEVEALLKEKLFEKGLQKEFYFRFTEIVKRYIETVRSFPAAELTTEEIAQRIGEQDRPLLNVLRHADLVKFSDAVAETGKKDEDVGCFLAYINVTAPGASDKGAGEGTDGVQG